MRYRPEARKASGYGNAEMSFTLVRYVISFLCGWSRLTGCPTVWSAPMASFRPSSRANCATSTAREYHTYPFYVLNINIRTAAVAVSATTIQRSRCRRFGNPPPPGIDRWPQTRRPRDSPRTLVRNPIQRGRAEKRHNNAL